MIFWILITLTALIAFCVFATQLDEPYGMPFLGALGTLIFGAAATWLIVGLLSIWIPVNHDLVRDETHQLKALGNSNSQDGRFYFLGGGYIDDKRVLNYISQREGGAIHVEQAEAEDSTIYEGSDSATVQIQRFDRVNGWVFPWPFWGYDEYTFRIPTGSVIESYTLDNK